MHGSRDRPSEAGQGFPAESASVPAARRFARSWSQGNGLSTGLTERVSLTVTELATNAVTHAQSPFRVVLAYDGRCVRIEVIDAGGELPRILRASPEATAGRGMALVRDLSSRMGVARGPGRAKRVWSELES